MSSSSLSSNFHKMKNGRSSLDLEKPLNEENLDDEVYIVEQERGYCALLFSAVQTLVLILMMWQCGVAPIQINPMVGPYPDALSEWGGKNSYNILEEGAWYRLLTPILLHAGVIHLVCNVAVTVETGVFFEREWGSLRWLVIYLSSAVGSSILSVIVMPNAVSVGSSGAVMGLFGGKLAEIFCRMCEADKTKQARVGHQVRKEQCVGVTCSVVLVMAFSFIPYVDWAAHLGGLLAGLAVGVVVFSLKIKTICWRYLWLLVGWILTMLYFITTLHHMYSGNVEVAEELKDVCRYYKENFPEYECNCMRSEYNNGD